MLAARLAGSRLVYHEHDSPGPGALRPSIARLRAMAARSAALVVFPNEQRARMAQAELGFAPDRLRIVWNLPRRAELPLLRSIPEPPLIVYYHGNISPDPLPETVVDLEYGAFTAAFACVLWATRRLAHEITLSDFWTLAAVRTTRI